MDLAFVTLLPATILGIGAACFWLVALILFIRGVLFARRGVRVQGRVTGFTDTMSRRRRMYSAIYEAQVPDGRTLQCTSGVATSWQSPPVGTVATLLYRPQDPSKPLATLGFSRFILCSVFAGTAAVLTIPAVSLLLSTRANPSNPFSPEAKPYFPQASVQAMQSAVAAQFQASVTGRVHSAGGELGSWDIALSDCQSGESNGFFGVDFYVAGSDHMRLRYVHDEAMGEIVKVTYPSKPGTANVFNRNDKCSVLEGSVEKMNVTNWTPKGRIRHLSGHLKFDCIHTDGTGHVSGEATFSHCH